MLVQTLIGLARLWFDSLPGNCVDSFDELLKQFMQQFSQQKRHTKHKNEILHIWRQDGESVESSITRFNRESLQIGGVSEDLMIAGSMQWVDHLIRKLHGPDSIPHTMEALMQIAKIYVKQEKTVALSRRSGKSKEV
jgi:hypothetical protein